MVKSVTEALIEYFFAFGNGGLDGVGGTDAVLKGGDGHGGNLCLVHTDFVEILGDAHIAAELLNGFNAHYGSFHGAESAGVAAEGGGDVGISLGAGAEVEAHDLGEEHGVGDTVGHSEVGAELVSHLVAETKVVDVEAGAIMAAISIFSRASMLLPSL